jgi:NADPH-dependent 2,4-dienoyl-CoA reductase/sulfur reductase-like enzyme
MNNLNYDVVVIGGGPAGLGAAYKASESGVSVLLIERNNELGGILNQCIHAGFGLSYFKKELTGPEYAELFIEKVENSNVDLLLNTMVTDITKDRIVTAINEDGVVKINAGSIILAMGCRERTRQAIMIPGSRPSGVFTAGQVQRYMNVENLKAGKKVVILGSGDIGLIMARRCILEGMKVLGVYEIMPYANGLYRNIVQCLDDFNIPLHLSTTITNIYGNSRLEAIEVSKVDAKGKTIPGTQERIECDTLLLSVGLIPENELSLKAGVELNPLTNGAIVNDKLETSIPGIFACGNALHVHDLVDNVTKEAEHAGEEAVKFVESNKRDEVKASINLGSNIRYTVPCTILNDDEEKVNLFFRVKKPIDKGCLVLKCGETEIYRGKSAGFKPSKMEDFNITKKLLENIVDDLYVDIEEAI